MIPDYQTLMLPLLKFVADKKEYKFREIVEGLALKFHVTDEERKEILPSGAQSIFDNRVGWARTYLKKAGLMEAPRRGIMKITERGLSVLTQKPEVINVRFLKQLPTSTIFN